MQVNVPGYRLSHNDVASQAYQLAYGQRHTGYALWKYVGWREDVPVGKQKYRAILAYVLTEDEVIVSVVGAESFTLAKLLYEQCTAAAPPARPPEEDAPVYTYTFLLTRELQVELDFTATVYAQARAEAISRLRDDLVHGDFDETGEQSIRLLKSTNPADNAPGSTVNWTVDVVG
jgi:hypothetical protein